jgi:effector-binding domain-containing protein
MKLRTGLILITLVMAFLLVGCAASNQQESMSGSDESGKMMADEGQQQEMMAKEGEHGEMMKKDEGEKMMAKEKMGHEHPEGCNCAMCVAKRAGFKYKEVKGMPYIATRYVLDTETTQEDMGPMMEEKFGMVAGALKEAGVKPAGHSFSLYYGEVEGGWDLAVGMPVAEPFEIEGFESGMLPDGKVLMTYHKGPYENLSETYTKWENFVKEHGIKLSGPVVEMYKVTAMETEDPAEYKTAIYQKVESMGMKDEMKMEKKDEMMMEKKEEMMKEKEEMKEEKTEEEMEGEGGE